MNGTIRRKSYYGAVCSSCDDSLDCVTTHLPSYQQDNLILFERVEKFTNLNKHVCFSVCIFTQNHLYRPWKMRKCIFNMSTADFRCKMRLARPNSTTKAFKKKHHNVRLTTGPVLAQPVQWTAVQWTGFRQSVTKYDVAQLFATHQMTTRGSGSTNRSSLVQSRPAVQ